MYFIHSIKNAVPTFVCDAPGGGGKIALQPNYLISQSADKIVLRNFEGVITTYPEPENYIPGTAEGYFQEVYPDMEEKRSNIGISALMNDTKFNLVPEGMERLNRREQYNSDPNHHSLKDKRDKRDQLKEKKFKSQQEKYEKSSSETKEA